MPYLERCDFAQLPVSKPTVAKSLFAALFLPLTGRLAGAAAARRAGGGECRLVGAWPRKGSWSRKTAVLLCNVGASSSSCCDTSSYASPCGLSSRACLVDEGCVKDHTFFGSLPVWAVMLEVQCYCDEAGKIACFHSRLRLAGIRFWLPTASSLGVLRLMMARISRPSPSSYPSLSCRLKLEHFGFAILACFSAYVTAASVPPQQMVKSAQPVIPRPEVLQTHFPKLDSDRPHGQCTPSMQGVKALCFRSSLQELRFERS